LRGSGKRNLLGIGATHNAEFVFSLQLLDLAAEISDSTLSQSGSSLAYDCLESSRDPVTMIHSCRHSADRHSEKKIADELGGLVPRLPRSFFGEGINGALILAFLETDETVPDAMVQELPVNVDAKMVK
jgi:hypothetical protein